MAAPTNAPNENNANVDPPVQEPTATDKQPPIAPSDAPAMQFNGMVPSFGGAVSNVPAAGFPAVHGGAAASAPFGTAASFPLVGAVPQLIHASNGMPFIFFNGQFFPVQQQQQQQPFPSNQLAAPAGFQPPLPPGLGGTGENPVAAAPTAPPAPAVAAAAALVAAAAPTNATAAVPPADADAEPNYLADLAKEASSHVLLGDTDANEAIRGRSNGSQTYHNRKMKEFNDFCHWIAEHPVLSHWGQLVPHADDPDQSIPKWIRALQHVPKTNKQAQSVLNTIFIEFFEEQKSRDGRQLMQPQSLKTKLKKVFSMLSNQFSVLIGMKQLQGEGSLESHCQARWAEVRLSDTTFGAKPFREIFTNEELKIVVSYIRNDCDVDSMAAQVAVVSLGRHLAFRGRQDYRNLEWGMVSFGVFEPGHPFAGQEYCQIGDGLLHKNHQITLCKSRRCRPLLSLLSCNLSTVYSSFLIANPTAPVDVVAPKVPVDMNDPFNPGCALRRLRQQTPPGAKYVFMSQAKPGIRMQYLASGRPGSQNWRYHEDIRMGDSSLGECTKSIAKLAGLPNWEKKTNHCLRQSAITDMVNNPDVTDIEAAKHARHKGTGTLPAYVRPTAQQEANRAAALEIKTPEPTKPPAYYGSGASQSGWI